MIAEGRDDLLLDVRRDPLDTGNLQVRKSRWERGSPNEHGRSFSSVVGVPCIATRRLGDVILANGGKERSSRLGVFADEFATVRSSFLAIWIFREFWASIEISFCEQVQNVVVTGIDAAVDEADRLPSEVVARFLLAVVQRLRLADTGF
jgi:hypothetical protein